MLSESAGNILSNYYVDDANATACFCKFMDMFFDMFYLTSMKVPQKKKEYLNPYRETDDARFIWLEKEFLPYLDNWNILVNIGYWVDVMKTLI